MRTARIGIDARFRAEAAAISPANAYSCVAPTRDRDRPLSVRDWTAANVSGDVGVGQALALQLGSPWTGLEAEPPARRSLLGLLALVAVDGAVPLLASLNAAALSGGDVLAVADLAVQAAGDAVGQTVRLRSSRHFWSNTAACEMVVAAKGGAPVVPSSNFLWMAGIDRTLWLLMSAHGRFESFVEIAGIRAHHHAETVMGIPLEATWFEHLEEAIKVAR